MKKWALALSLGMILGSTATVAAATNETIQATIAQFAVKFNGEEQQIKSPILVVDGVSYLPLREVSSLFGYQIGYDDATRTINVDQQLRSNPIYETATITPDMSEWINVLDEVSFLKINDVKASVTGDSSITINLGAFGVGFPIPFEEQYKDTETAKLHTRKNSKLSLLLFNKNLYIIKNEVKELGFPIEEEWMLLSELQNPNTKFDLLPLDGAKKLTNVFLQTDKGIIRAMNSSKGIMLNKLDLQARGIVE